MKAVRFHEYGGIDVLRVEEVDWPAPGPGQMLVEVRAAGIQSGEVMIREGARHGRWPATFPSGQGSDLAGAVAEVGPRVRGFAVATRCWASPMAGRATRSSSWPARPGTPACSRWTPGRRTRSWCPVRRAVSGLLPCSSRGATAIGLASEADHAWLKGRGVVLVAYGEGVAERIREACGGKVDTFGDGGARTYREGAAACAVVVGEPERGHTHGKIVLRPWGPAG
ncbi:alcohol dehydrogenase catalytic domain-containing protein [Streptomyces sp. S3(2020)]|uniref:alcohol dehydrogenase catalytic domain-containing protein n=1 Tax=Streptomyces sp. S3(2020) TaxID=2732044 RepID=UPI00148961AE|nr:alcohol dehydrogenase catalytic domain-containing protein [Streptomyces sp. S3(2020)]NNN34893.1 alcohol dehydrogenase catalytic domain-containing protein [Streptomyces sp. S3(2020)]